MPIAPQLTPDDVSRFIRRLKPRFAGDIRADRLIRALYATDASIYELPPDVVCFPKSAEDIQQAVRACAELNVAITPRGAGTGLTGAAVNHGVQLDCSRYLNCILDIDPDNRTATVEPGVVLDHLNAALAPHGLQFAPDVATSSRATIGGMIANNSCGAHSVLYGRTVDHVLSLDVVLSDGSLACWGCDDHNIPSCTNPLARHCDDLLREILTQHADDIATRYPKVLRSNAGYGLDRLLTDRAHIDQLRTDRMPPPLHEWRTETPPEARASRKAARTHQAPPGAVLDQKGEHADESHALATGCLPPNAPPHTPELPIHKLLCGSEGTLGIVTRAVLNLVPLPRSKGLLVVQFPNLLDALAAVPAALQHHCAAVELIDALILNAARQSPKLAAGSKAITGSPEAVLVIELYDDVESRLMDRLRAARRDLLNRQHGDVHTIVTDAVEQEAVWNMRKAGLGLLMSKPGDNQPYAFVEDTAVDPARLRDYIARFAGILASEDVGQAGYYAHASVGCLHVRPVLNLKQRDDVARMRRIAERVSALAFEFGGTMTGEHGDGLLRSEWIEKLYGPHLVHGFRQIKRTFDPQNILNPGKIVDPPPMTRHLRYGDAFHANRSARAEATLDFSTHGGMIGLAGMCSGVGQCRQMHVGTMCPSYEGTSDEMHTTRARANALRLALSNRSLLADLDDPALDEVMDLCISCKACKTECPTGVDMARLKAEWQHRKHQKNGPPLRSQLIAHTAHFARIASKVPNLANAIAQSNIARRLADKLFGIDQRVPPPRLATETFRTWYANRDRSRPSLGSDRCLPGAIPTPNDGGQDKRLAHRVLYFVDTWTDLITPGVGKATIQLLEALGYEVIVPPPICCGRPAISKGLLDIAHDQLEHAVRTLAPLVGDCVAIVGTEPSCISALIDELPQLIRTPDAQSIANRAQMIETFLTRKGSPARGQCEETPDARYGMSPTGWAEPTTPPGAPRSSPQPRASGGLPPRASTQPNTVLSLHGKHADKPVPVHYHAHCHQKALFGTDDAMTLLRMFGIDAIEINSGCCGMAGAFGHEREHHDVAQSIGESRLFPAIRNHPDARIAISGFSCRHQIAHHTPATPIHIIELIAHNLGL